MLTFAIYIPTYNVGRTVVDVIERIPAAVMKDCAEIFVVDNASQDDTCEQILAYKEQKGLSKLTLIRNEINLGYGGSQKIAYRYAIGQGYGYVIMLHGDGQYKPELIGTILDPLMKHDFAFFYGSRMTGHPLKGRMPLYRFLANIVLTKMGNLILGSNLSEFHSGYRGYNCSVLRRAPLERFSNDYSFDTQIIVWLIENKFRIGEVTIPTHYGKESKSISFYECLFYGVNFIRNVLKLNQS